MKKMMIPAFLLILSVFMLSCGTVGDLFDDIQAQEDGFDEITSIRDSVVLDIAITLNEYYVRYYDSNEGAFDVTVTGNVEEYEILYLPMESQYAEPELDDSGLPYAVGQYEVAVKCSITNIIETCQTGLFVEIINRPPLIDQLVGRTEDIIYSEIINNTNWEEEVSILTEEDIIIENDYYIAHLNAGDLYSSWLFPFLDEIISSMHELTGMHLPDSNEKVYIWFGDSRWGPAPMAGRDDRTGDLILYLQDYKINPLFEMSNEERSNFSEYSLNQNRHNWMEALVSQFAHEYTHILSFAFLDMDTYSWIHEEGYSTFVGGFTKERFVKNPMIKITNPDLEDSILDIISDYAHNRLEDVLSRDTGAGDLGGAGRPFGAVFYRYIFEEYGNMYAFEIHKIMNQRPDSPSRLEIIEEILGKDISASFPAWFDKNANEIEIHW